MTNKKTINVIFITTEWTDTNYQAYAPFLVQQAEFLQREGVNFTVYYFHGKGNPLNYIKAWFDIRRQSEWKDTDILHAHWGQSGLLALNSKKKLVVTFWGSDLHGTVNNDGEYTVTGKLLVLISKFIAKKADYCIAVSKRLQELIPSGVNSEIIPSGLDFSIFHPMEQMFCREKLGLNKSKKYILFVANPNNPIKRYKLAVDAVNCLDNYWNADLLVVNGHDHTIIPFFMNAGDVLILTSTHEGSPTIVKEALGCNLPIVSVDVGDVRELIDKIGGCEICESSPKSLAEGLKKVLSRGERIDAYEKIQFLDESHIAKKIIAVYRRVLADA